MANASETVSYNEEEKLQKFLVGLLVILSLLVVFGGLGVSDKIQSLEGTIKEQKYTIFNLESQVRSQQYEIQHWKDWLAICNNELQDIQQRCDHLGM